MDRFLGPWAIHGRARTSCTVVSLSTTSVKCVTVESAQKKKTCDRNARSLFFSSHAECGAPEFLTRGSFKCVFSNSLPNISPGTPSPPEMQTLKITCLIVFLVSEARDCPTRDHDGPLHESARIRMMTRRSLAGNVTNESSQTTPEL